MCILVCLMFINKKKIKKTKVRQLEIFLFYTVQAKHTVYKRSEGKNCITRFSIVRFAWRGRSCSRRRRSPHILSFCINKKKNRKKNIINLSKDSSLIIIITSDVVAVNAGDDQPQQQELHVRTHDSDCCYLINRSERQLHRKQCRRLEIKRL